MRAAMHGAVTIVQALLQYGVDVQLRTDSGMSALSFAMKEENHEVVRVLAMHLDATKTLGNHHLISTLLQAGRDRAWIDALPHFLREALSPTFPETLQHLIVQYAMFY